MWTYVADRAHSTCTCYYFQAETTIIVSLNSEGCEIEEGIHDAARRAKSKTFFQCCLLLRARSTLQAEQDSV